MQKHYNTQVTDNTSEENKTSVIDNISSIFERDYSPDVLLKRLDNLISFPRKFHKELSYLRKNVSLLKCWIFATPNFKTSFSLHLSGNRSQVWDGVSREFFIFTHQCKADCAESSVKTMQRANLFFERKGVIKRALRKKVSSQKTLNYYKREKWLRPIRVGADGELYIKHTDKFGNERFTLLYTYVENRITELENIQKSYQKDLQKNPDFERECPSNYNDLMYINTSKGFSKEKRASKKISPHMQERIERGIFQHALKEHIKLSPTDIPKFRWYDDETIYFALNVMQDMSVSKFEGLKNPAHYMLAICRNKKNGDTSWKTKLKQRKSYLIQ